MPTDHPQRLRQTTANHRWRVLPAPLLLAALLAFFTGCGPSKPKPMEAEKAAMEYIHEQSDGRIKVVAFKTTTPEPEGRGGETYYWSYTAEIEFVENCRWRLDRITESVNVDFRTLPLQSQAGEESAGRPMKQGDRRRVTGTVHLEKSKKSWEPGRVSILTNHAVE